MNDNWALPTAPDHDWSLPPQPKQDNFRKFADILLNPLVIVGITAFLIILYLISFSMVWARYPNDEVVVNGFGWSQMNVLNESSGFIGPWFFLSILLVVALGKGAFMVAFTDKRKLGIQEILGAGGMFIVYAVFAMMSKMLVGLFIDFEDPYSAALLGIRNPLDDLTAVSGAGPAFCLFIGLLTVVFGGLLFAALPETRMTMTNTPKAPPVPPSIPPDAVYPTASEVSARAIAEFWQWWPTGDTSQLGARVAAIHPDLVWDVDPNARRLTVSPGIFPSLRATARRWLNAAPQCEWTFSDRLAATPGVPVVVNGIDYDPAEAIIGEPDGMLCPSIEIWHPKWGGLRSLFSSEGSGNADPRAAALLINRALGDTVAFSWINDIDAVGTAPHTHAPLPALPEIMTEFAAIYDGILSSGQRCEIDAVSPDGFPVTISSFLPLTSELAPQCDLHVHLTYQVHDTMYAQQQPVDVPGSVKELTQALDAMLAEVSGVLVVYTAQPHHMEAHLYVDSQDPGLQILLDRIYQVLNTWKLGPVTMKTDLDPSWWRIDQFRS